jgi:hypothetical protein
MRRRILNVLLALGPGGGYASGFSSLRHRSQCRHSSQAPTPPSAEPPTPAGPR